MRGQGPKRKNPFIPKGEPVLVMTKNGKLDINKAGSHVLGWGKSMQFANRALFRRNASFSKKVSEPEQEITGTNKQRHHARRKLREQNAKS